MSKSKSNYYTFAVRAKKGSYIEYHVVASRFDTAVTKFSKAYPKLVTKVNNVYCNRRAEMPVIIK